MCVNVDRILKTVNVMRLVLLCQFEYECSLEFCLSYYEGVGLCRVCWLFKLFVFVADVTDVDLYGEYVFVCCVWVVSVLVVVLVCVRVVCVGVVVRFSTSLYTINNLHMRRHCAHLWHAWV